MAWANLPSRSDPRWLIPRGPRAVARSGLFVYHPVTQRGVAAWLSARLLASIGGLHVLRPGASPPEAVMAILDPLMWPQGTLALARANHPNRYVALLIDRDGTCRAAAKVALAEEGRRALEREASAIRAYGGFLMPPLAAPTILEEREGILMLDAVLWRPRLRPWHLPEEIAFALGKFFRSGGRNGGDQGPAHGDFAPWNLLRSDGSWVLIDWEEAWDGAPPFLDLFHYLVRGHALLGHPSRSMLVAGAAGKGPVGALVRAYADGANVSAGEAPKFLRGYLEREAGMPDASEPAGRALIEAHRTILADLEEQG
jgi:hypothetical protein